MERIKRKKSKYKVISLFAWIWWFDLWFEFAWFNVIWANDFDKYAVETYKANVSDNIILWDIREVKKDIPEHDILVWWFPCQPFSTLWKLKWFDDEERGTLFFEIKDIIKKHNTKVVVLENVKNLMNHDKGKTFKRIIKELEELWYFCYYDVLNSLDFWVPQRRNRVFLLAFKKEFFNQEDFIFPKKIPLNITTFDLLDKDVSEKYFISNKMLWTILWEWTKWYIVKPTINQEISKTLTASMHKMHRASQDNYFHDDKNYKKYCNKEIKSNLRKLTPNECRKLQWFPSDWNQVVSDTQAYKQFWNAITVNVSYNLAKQLREYIENNIKQ